jgi:MraZ protein
LFLGIHVCTLDKQNHLLAPRAVQEQFIGDLYICRGFDHNLLILTENSFQEVYRRVMSLNLTDPLARLLFRLILGSASQIVVNESGQLNIPPGLMQFAEIQEQAIAIGMGDYLEIWSPDLWKKQEEELKDTEKNSARFSGLSIATR